jgi:hypothetical protein
MAIVQKMLGSLDTGHQELPCGFSAVGDSGGALEPFAGYYDIKGVV